MRKIPPYLVHFIVFAFIIVCLSRIYAAGGLGYATDKDDKAIRPAESEEEKKLLSELKVNPEDSKSSYSLGDYYLKLAVEYDMQYLWGTPRSLAENQDVAVFYSIKAIEHLSGAAKKDVTNATLLAKLAEAYGLRIRNGGLGTKLKYLDDFNNNLEKALELDPENFEALITKAFKTLYSPSLLVNRNKAALTQFEKLYKIYPDNPEITKGLAITYDRLGQTEKALDFIQRSLSVKPKDLESIALKVAIEKKLAKLAKERKA